MKSPPGSRKLPRGGSAARRMLPSLLSLTVILTGTLSARAAQLPLAPTQPPGPQVVQITTVNLAECLQLAHQRQPRIAAQRASLAAAEDGFRGLENLQVPALLAPELPIRRRQAALGVNAANAGVDQAERETVYGVTRTYFTLLYAREQEKVARGIVDRLKSTRDAAKQKLEGGARDITENDVNRASAYVHLAEVKRIQATQGVKRALAALKEAIGLGPQACIEVAPGRLVPVDLTPTRDEVVALALARRAELIRAGIFADVTCLEIEAQGTGMHKKMETFAAGSDIHAVQVPQGVQNSEYRPGAVPPEMPTLLAGCRQDRVKRAQSLYARALTVVEVSRNLITLEAEDAFLRWEQATSQLEEARAAVKSGDQLANNLSTQFAAGSKIKVDEVVTARVLAAQARSQYNEYVYHQILALADLERITAGGFCARLVEIAVPAAPSEAKGNGMK